MSWSDLDNLIDNIQGLSEAEKFTLSNTIFLESFGNPDIKKTHPVMGKVRSGNKVPVISSDGDFGSLVHVDGCKLPQCEISPDFSEFTWCIHEIGCEFTLCLKTEKEDILAFFETYRAMGIEDINSQFAQFVKDNVSKSHLKAELRVAYFGVADSEDPLVSGCDGFVAQMDALANVDPNLKVEITENAEATEAGQTLSDGDAIYNYFREMYDRLASYPWQDDSKMVWRMNRSIAQRFVAFLNNTKDLSQYNCDCIDPDAITRARGFTVDNLSIFGYPVEVYDFEGAMKATTEWWDGTRFVNGKNLIILARKDVFLLGYENENSFSQFDMDYDKRDREIWIHASSMFGSAISVPYFIYAM